MDPQLITEDPALKRNLSRRKNCKLMVTTACLACSSTGSWRICPHLIFLQTTYMR